MWTSARHVRAKCFGGPDEVFGRMSAGTSGRKLFLWADFSFLDICFSCLRLSGPSDPLQTSSVFPLLGFRLTCAFKTQATCWMTDSASPKLILIANRRCSIGAFEPQVEGRGYVHSVSQSGPLKHGKRHLRKDLYRTCSFLYGHCPLFPPRFVWRHCLASSTDVCSSERCLGLLPRLVTTDAQPQEQ